MRELVAVFVVLRIHRLAEILIVNESECGETGAGLPFSVRAAIALAQDRSERLIGWIQLSVVVTFGALYALSRIDVPANTFVTPMAIGLYLSFTLARLGYSYRRRLSPWLIAGSVIVDISLLYALIWSFHQQYEQEPAFYLKAPTLLYVFIFIALRALRFEVQYIVIAGIAAAFGWLVLVAYAVMNSAHGAFITHDYVRYLTSNELLLGGEFDKVASILAVTGILALATRGARHLMFSAYVAGSGMRNLSQFFDPRIADHIAAHGDEIVVGTGELREVAILNIDLRGFTQMASQLDPREVMSILTQYQAAMVPIIQGHGGAVDKFMGDGIMATFGAVRPRPTYAADACRSLESVIEAASKWALERRGSDLPSLCVNGAVTTGRVVVGVIGEENRREFTVIGDAVNLCAKLEKHNKQIGSRAVVAADGYSIALSQGYVASSDHRSIPKASIDGLSAPIDIVAIA